MINKNSLLPQLCDLLKSNSYLDKDATGKLVESKQKNIRLDEVFQLTIKEAEEELEKPLGNDETLCSRLDHLKDLNSAGEKRYNSYCSKTKSWKFASIRLIARLFPERILQLLQRIFPIFNRLREENCTSLAYQSYQNFIKEKMTLLEKQDIPSNVDHQLEAEKQISPVAEKIYELCDRFQTLQSKPLPNHPAHLFCEVKQTLLDFNHYASQLDPSLYSHLPPSLLKWITPDSNTKRTLLTCAFDQFDRTGNHQGLKEMMTDLWEPEFANEMLNLLDSPLLLFYNRIIRSLQFSKSGTLQNPSLLDSYAGMMKIQPLTSTELQNLLTQLQKVLKENIKCHPCGLTIQLPPNQTLDAQLIATLSTLSQTIPYIRLEGLTQLNLSALTTEDQKQFFDLLPHLDSAHPSLAQSLSIPPSRFSSSSSSSSSITHSRTFAASSPQFNQSEKTAPAFRSFTLPAQAAGWPEQQLRSLIKFWPATHIDLSEVPISDLPRILAAFPCIESLTLNHPEFTDDHFFEFKAKGFLQNLTRLNLEGCTGLTTNILLELMQIPTLSQLNCPQIRQGSLPLPELMNPWDVKLFYTSAQATHESAGQRYKGSPLLAALFQIPIVRSGGQLMFPKEQKILDPKSATYWVYQDDYQRLAPQPSIQSVIADNCPYLSDANLTSFIKKFPCADEISLYNCPSITTTGVIELLQQCPQIAKLDLTSCPGITSTLLSEENRGFLENLETLHVSDTQITQGDIDALPLELRKKLRWVKQTLKISDSELQQIGSLKAVLNAHLPLNELVRLDLQGCQSLRPIDFHKLLDLLNVESKIIDAEGHQILNPYRLNIAELNLSQTKCTPYWFREHFLGSLNQVVISDPKHVAELQKEFPSIHFQERYVPLVNAINLSADIENCQRYLKGTDQEEREKYAKTYLQSRIAVELFGENSAHQPFLEELASHRIFSANREEFFDQQVTFSDGNGSYTSFTVFRDLLYTQSPFLRNEMRRGGTLANAQPTLENQNATPFAAETIVSLMRGETLDPTLHWRTLAETAELANRHNLNLSDCYEQLMRELRKSYKEMPVEYLYSEEAHEMLSRAIRLDDARCVALLESRLCQLLVEDYDRTGQISSLAAENMPILSQVCGLITEYKLVENQLRELDLNPEMDPDIFDENGGFFEEENRVALGENSEALFQQLTLLQVSIDELAMQLRQIVEAFES